MPNTREPIKLGPEAVDQGYKNCRKAVGSYYKGKLWPARNLPGDQHRAIDVLLFNLMQSIDLWDLESENGLSIDTWYEIRDDLSNAFMGSCTSVELAALADARQRFNIPKQFFFDPLRGADLWIRNHEFAQFDELEAFCSYVGGSSLASAIPVLGCVKPDFEFAAIQTGKAIMLTRILANFVTDVQQNRIFLAVQDLEDCRVDVRRLNKHTPGKSFRFLVRRYGARIEKWFHDGSRLIQHLDFDGKRTIKALLAWHWKMLLNMQAKPECIMAPEGVLSRGEQLILQSNHLMGIEKDIPIIIDESNDH